MSRRWSTVAATALAVALLAGCTGDPLAEQYRDGADAGYITGEGYREYLPEERFAPVEFEGVTDTGEQVSSSDYAGEVTVVNFWYASCPPCRAEAADLEALAQEYSEQGVQFLGVNTRDQAGNAQAFARTHGVTYPSILDVNDTSVQLAFAGSVPPNAVPTTVVLDREGRVAARWLGIIDKSSLAAMIDRVLGESS